jgi:hypothetical protein
MRRASSLVKRLAAARRPRFIFKVKIAERLPVLVADDEAGVSLFGCPRRREAAGAQSYPTPARPSLRAPIFFRLAPLGEPLTTMARACNPFGREGLND